MVSHAEEMGVEIINKEITSVQERDGGFEIHSDDCRSFSSHLILATGSIPRPLDVSGILYRIEWEIDLEGKRVLIVGGGDLAIDNALRCRDFGADVTVLHRSVIKANRGLLEEAVNSGIVFREGYAEDIKIEGDVLFLKDKSEFDLAAAFIGRYPERSLIREMDIFDFKLPSHSTTVNGLYLIGDAASVAHSQAAYAMSSGIACAMDIARRVRNDESGT
jgi:thioredoxin reductase